MMPRTYTELLRSLERTQQELRDHQQGDNKLLTAARELVEKVRVIVGQRTADDPPEIDAVHRALEDVEDLVG